MHEFGVWGSKFGIQDWQIKSPPDANTWRADENVRSGFGDDLGPLIVIFLGGKFVGLVLIQQRLQALFLRAREV
jgi:hypothetical protein